MKPIPSFPNYTITKDGLTITGLGSIKKKITLQYDKDGYLSCGLYKDGTKYYCRVHRLVGETYIPNPENKLQINHINGIKCDNRIINLEWCTASENVQHAYNTGLYDNARTESSIRAKSKPKEHFSSMGKGNRKLTDDDVRNIRHLASTKQKSYKELASIYNYDVSSIGKIVRKQRYSEVE